MGYPTEQRFKILQQQFQDAEQISSPAPSQRPQAFPGLIIDYIDRADSGYALKVIPFNPKSVSSAGDLTFLDGSNPIPDNKDKLFYIKVCPVDCAPAQVKQTYTTGDPIMVYPYWGGGVDQDRVKGSFICVDGSPPVAVPQYQGMALCAVSQNQLGGMFLPAVPFTNGFGSGSGS